MVENGFSNICVIDADGIRKRDHDIANYMAHLKQNRPPILLLFLSDQKQHRKNLQTIICLNRQALVVRLDLPCKTLMKQSSVQLNVENSHEEPINFDAFVLTVVFLRNELIFGLPGQTTTALPRQF